MKVYVLMQSDSSFMSHDITKVHIATTNKQVLEAILRDCEVLDSQSTFSITTLEFPQRVRSIAYQSESDSDWNFCWERETVVPSEFKEGATTYEMPVKHSINKVDRRGIYTYLCTWWVKALNDHRHEKRLMNSGEYWNYQNYGFRRAR